MITSKPASINVADIVKGHAYCIIKCLCWGKSWKFNTQWKQYQPVEEDCRPLQRVWKRYP